MSAERGQGRTEQAGGGRTPVGGRLLVVLVTWFCLCTGAGVGRGWHPLPNQGCRNPAQACASRSNYLIGWCASKKETTRSSINYNALKITCFIYSHFMFSLNMDEKSMILSE